MSNTIPTNPLSRRREMAKLLTLGIIRLKKCQQQRNVSANDPRLLDKHLELWIDSTTHVLPETTSLENKP